MQMPQRFDAQHGGELFPVNEGYAAPQKGQGHPTCATSANHGNKRASLCLSRGVGKGAERNA
jgi:hypothetical protein